MTSEINKIQPTQELAAKDPVLGRALVITAATVLSRILGLVRDQLFAAFFRPAVKDAWTAAFRLPNLLRKLLGEGTLSVAFIPVFVRLQTESDPARAKNLVNAFYSLLLIALLTATLLGTLWPELLLRAMLDSNFVEDTSRFDLTVSLARIMFGFVFFICSYAFATGVLNALGFFALPALAPVLFNIVVIGGNLLAHFGDGGSVRWVAWAVVGGGFAQVLLLWPLLYRQGYLPRLRIPFRDADSRQQVRLVLTALLPSFFAVGLLQLNTLINLYFASGLKIGTVTCLYLADRLLELPLSLVSVSLGAALLPSLSLLWSGGQGQEFRELLQKYLRLNLFIAWPAAVGLFMLATPIVRLLFFHGIFSEDEVGMTAQILRLYAVVIVTSSVVRILVPAYFASGQIWRPAVAGGIAMLVHLITCWWWVPHYGLAGLLAGTLVSAICNLLLLMFNARFQLFAGLLKAQLRWILGLAVMVAFLAVVQSKGFDSLWFLPVEILIAALLYFAVVYALKDTSAKALFQRFKS